jgi:hypothetical protein
MGLDPTTFSPKFRAMVDGGDKPTPAVGNAALPVAERTNLVTVASTDEQKLNKLERAWLRVLRLTHPAENIGIQSITLKLGDDCRYTPDFWTIDPDGQIHFWETKGFRVRLGQAKIIIAARQFRWARFILVEKSKGQFLQTPINP